MFKRKKKRLSLPGRIISADGNRLVVEFEVDKNKYRKGQMIVATVSDREKTKDGKYVTVSDVVAQGRIEHVKGNRITINTPQRNSIVSRQAVEYAEKNNKPVNLMVVQ